MAIKSLQDYIRDFESIYESNDSEYTELESPQEVNLKPPVAAAYLLSKYFPSTPLHAKAPSVMAKGYGEDDDWEELQKDDIMDGIIYELGDQNMDIETFVFDPGIATPLNKKMVIALKRHMKENDWGPYQVWIYNTLEEKAHKSIMDALDS